MMDIARQRLNRSFLIGRPFSTGRDVVRALGAVQAQDYEGAKWALSLRTSGLTDEAIEREYAAGAILRTHVLRPTWHFVDPVDIRWMLALTAPRIMQAMASYDRKLELDAKVYRRSHAALIRALRDGTHLTRAELKTVLARSQVGPLGVQRAAHIMMRAELDAVVCSGPRRGRQFTYALLDERVPPASPLQRDEALLELTRRYFRTRGPATARDFAWWSGLAMADVRSAIELARHELESATIGDEVYWNAGDPIAETASSAHLLPNYDEFFIGFRDRSAIGLRLKNIRAVTGGNALISYVVVIDGQLVGGWRRTPGRDAVRIDLKLATRLSPGEQKRVRDEVRRYGAFAGRPIELHGLGGRTAGAPARARKRTGR